MDSIQRRKEIIVRLQNSVASVNATKLANEFGVTRQIIVADIALLRAAGHDIVADNRGYKLRLRENGCIKRIAVKHGAKELTEELYAVVDFGGRVLDVIVEHSIYGNISADLNLSSRYDVDMFVKRVSETGATPLSLLTEGFHLHTLEVRDEETFAHIKARLHALGILISTD